jgi:uncharacterized protein
MHRIATTLAALLCSFSLLVPVAARSATPATDAKAAAKPAAKHKVAKQKVVFQVSDGDPAKWNLTLNNARNVQDALGKDNVQIEVVAYGPGLGMLKRESKVQGRLAQALDDNVTLIACENTMINTHTTKEDMYTGISYTPGGVIHIMKREREGWSYIRP